MFKNYRNDRCYIIAEIGGNFTTFDEAKRLIDEAYQCQVDAIKLQTYTADTLASKDAVFDMENTGITSQFELFKKYEIDEKLHKEIFSYAEQAGLDWFSTPSHINDVELLDRCGVGAYKIGSDDAVNIPFLRQVSKKGKPIILSTGMCTLDEVRVSVETILSEGISKLVLLHATTSYPTHAENVNLSAIQTMAREFPQCDVGYSDHTLSSLACICAVAMGAKVIEKHFTYDKNADGPDHILSSDPREMKALVDSIRTFETMRGTGIKVPASSEETTRKNNRKSIVVTRHIRKGEILCEHDLAIKRPGHGITPADYSKVVGKACKRDIEFDDILNWDDIS